MEPEFWAHFFERLLEGAERGDPTASLFLATPVIVFLVLAVLFVVLVARELWARRKKGFR